MMMPVYISRMIVTHLMIVTYLSLFSASPAASNFNQIENDQVTERLDFTLKCTRLGSETPHLRLHA